MSDLDPRGLEAAARVVAHQNSEILGHDTWGELEDEQRDCLRGEAAEIITAYLAAAQPVVETVEELEGLPVGAVIRCHSGTILESYEAWEADLIWFPTDDDGARKSREVPLPARVIWRPHESA